VGFQSLTTPTHHSKVNLPSSGQEVTAQPSARKVSVAGRRGGSGQGPRPPGQGLHREQPYNTLVQTSASFNGKAVPLHTWSGPESSRKLHFPDYMTMAQGGVKVVSLTHRPPLPPRNVLGIHFC